MNTATEVPPLCARLRGLVIFGWAIAAIRFAMEAGLPDISARFPIGVYILMPLALAFVGLTRRWGPIPWKTMAKTMVVLALLVWALPNTITYTTGQFMEWGHGRFGPTESPPLAPTAIGKIGAGLIMGGFGAVGGTIICTLVGTLLIWLPGRSKAA